ncbi:MAG: L,D-transpeptidase family protein [Christensenellales bacterium]|jgi:hypothetical protein
MKRRFSCAAVALLLCATFLLSMAPATAYAWRPDPVTYANADPERYTIIVDLVNKIVTVYEREGDNAYGSIARQSLCTIGASGTETPAGSWRLTDRRRRFGYFSKYDVYAQYWVQVVGGIYFHSILYTKPQEGHFTRTSFYALGTAASHGCIRLLVEDARWIYYNCPPGTLVVVTRNKAENPELVASLKPKFTSSKYRPEPDEYEAANLALPRGAAKRGSALLDSKGNFVATVEKGEFFEILLSGYPKSTIRLSSGETGLLENERILFLDNSPGSVVHELTADAKVYERPNNATEPIATLAKGTQINILGSTVYFHRIEASGTVGYVLKSRVQVRSLSLEQEDFEALLDADDDSEEISFSMMRVKSESANLYERASNRYDPIARFGKGTDLIVLSSTENFHKVSVGGYTGYILKRDCHKVNVIHSSGKKYSLRVFELDLSEEGPPEDED